MDTAVLVRTQREVAWNLLEALQREQFPMTAAYWHYLPDAETWRLVIATELVDTMGSIYAYTALQTLLNRLPQENPGEMSREAYQEISEEFSVANITLLSPKSKQLLNLKKRYGRVPRDRSHVRRVSLSPDEAYIYFLD